MNTAVQFDEEEAAGECWGPSLFQEKKKHKNHGIALAD